MPVLPYDPYDEVGREEYYEHLYRLHQNEEKLIRIEMLEELPEDIVLNDVSQLHETSPQ